MKKHIGLVIIALILVVLGIILLLSYRANLELERVVTEQFNDQQLVLAQKIASDIRLHFSFLETTLQSFSRQLAVASSEGQNAVSIPALLEFLKEWGVLGIGLIRPEFRSQLIYLQAGWTQAEDLGLSLDSPICPEHVANKRPVCLSLTVKPGIGPLADRWVMTMSTPQQPVLPETKPIPGMAEELFFLLDAQGIARRYAHGVHSGKTGYPWVIDHKGYFMYHVEENFDGQNSLTIRHERNPAISYERINNLVANRLLKGEEGTDWYISGWHWDVIREMKKLFAFSPIVLSAEQGHSAHVWSVGLVAPDTEVYGLIKPIVIRQLLIFGLFFGFVLVSFAAFLLVSLRWSEALRLEVDKKTEHLLRSENELRQERDRVKQGMEQLVQTQKKLVLSERFAAIGEAAVYLSHEIKNPLMLMGGFARQILHTLPADDARCEKLRIIVEEARRLEAILMDVRDFTRPLQPQKKLMDVNEIVRDVVALIQETLRNQGIRLELRLASDLPRCRFDPNQIKQVLLNLVKNAVEAMPGGGELRIITRMDKTSLLVVVKDTGMGISPDGMQRLFHPFYSTKQKGTGLGLAVSYKIVQDHGGDLFAQSREGSGSSFSFVLPLSSE